MPARKIDHLVYTVPDLEAAMDDLENRLGVRPVFGGYHATQGTKNALVKLNDGAYLEILAADAENTAITPPRWMGVDCLTRPQLTRWALKTEDLEADGALLRGYHPEMGRAVAGSRQRPDGSWLRWTLNLPLPLPEVEVVPFMVDWRKSEVHPHDVLPEMGCCLEGLSAIHPNPDKIGTVLTALGWSMPVTQGPQVALRAVLRCPAGSVTL